MEFEAGLAERLASEEVVLTANGLSSRHVLAALLFPRGLTFEASRNGIRALPR